jgi:2,4-dienoyl-CoA reductase-like NADH-dependent reductase (Old Yellow Enzyme family)
MTTTASANARDHLMTVDVEPLFQPLHVRGLALANRIVMAPMTRSFSPNGIPGPDVAAYYRRRAEGGTGLVITEGVGIDHAAALGEAGLGERDLPQLHGSAALVGWRRVVDEVHAAGGKIVPQLWHQGVMREQGTGPHPEVPSVRPSGLWGPAGRLTSSDADYLERVQSPTRPASDSDIQDIIDAYARSARHARELGFDGIAIHGAHGYLIDTFLWDETNRRSDAWGGDRRARTRFAVEVVRAIRREAGEALPIFFRFSQWKQQDFKARLANTPQALEEVLGPIADAGVDVFDGSVRYFDRAEFDGSPLNLSGWAKKLTGKLAMAVGGIGLDRGFYDSKRDGRAGGSDNMALLMARFERAEFDLIAVGRALLNEPTWPRKLRDGHELPAFDEARLKELI